MAARGSSQNRFQYWACARTRFKQEQRAAYNVEHMGFAYYLPRCAALLRPGVERRELLFPGFIFVMIDVRKRWQALASARGVAGLFMCGEYPTRVPPREIAAMRDREDARGLVVLRPQFESGAPVRVRDGHGSLAGLVGAYEVGTAAGRCAVLAQVMGRAVRFEFDARQLEAA